MDCQLQHSQVMEGAKPARPDLLAGRRRSAALRLVMDIRRDGAQVRL